MARWQPDAKKRLESAALELFSHKGYDETTAAEIAASVGLTERTFFRHFGDKREVLFRGRVPIQELFTTGIRDSPADADLFHLLAAGLREGSRYFPEERKAFARARQTIIGSHPALQERERLKLSELSLVVHNALAERGIADPQATLAAQSTATVFHVALTQWVADAETRPLADIQLDTLRTLRDLWTVEGA